MRKLARLEFNNHKTLQQPVEENQVDEKFVILKHNPFLPRNKAETIAHFHDKVLKMVDNGLLKIAFVILGLLLKSQELQPHRVLDNLLRCFRDAFFSCDSQDSFLVVAQAKPFPQLGMYLTLKLALCPAMTYRLKLVIFTFLSIFY